MEVLRESEVLQVALAANLALLLAHGTPITIQIFSALCGMP